MPEFGFIGGSYTSWSPLADASRSMNLFPERIESVAQTLTTKPTYVLYGSPGLVTQITLPTTGIRAMFEGEGRTFVVAGSILYEIFFLSGTLSTSGTAVTRVSGSAFDTINGVAGNLMIIAGVTFTVSTWNSVTSVTLTTSAGTQTGVPYTAMTYHARGNVGNDFLPVQMFPNGNQLMIVSAGSVYVDGGAGPVIQNFSGASSGFVNTAGLVATWVSGDLFDQTLVNQTVTVNSVSNSCLYVSPDGKTMNVAVGMGTHTNVTWTAGPYPVTASGGAFLDGYFIVAIPNTKQINISAINDGTSWSPLDYAIKEAYPDNIAALLSDHEELWIFGTQTSEVWRDTGASTFPLERDPGAFIQMGCIASASPVRLISPAGAGVAWLGGDPRGWTVAYFAIGYAPSRVSTHAVEQAWATYATTADAVSYVYTDRGHQFWVLSFPGADATWVYDATENFWHERGWWNGTTNGRQRGAAHVFGFGLHLVGDYATGAIYAMSMDTYDDAGTAIHRIRAAPEPLGPDEDWVFHGRFRLEADGASLNPSLDWSIDGGHTFNTPRTTTSQAAGALAVYDYRRLGRSRARVWRVTITAAVKVALINAFTRH